MKNKNRLLYVCHSNKGRSIALAVYTDYFLKQKGLNLLVDSAGVSIEMIDSLRERGIDRASQNTAKILQTEGIDISEHKVNYVGEKISGSDLILVSDELSLVRLRIEFPDYKEKSFLAKKYAGFSRDLEIFGPYAEKRRLKNPEWTELIGYEHMLREIKAVSKRVVKRLESELGK